VEEFWFIVYEVHNLEDNNLVAAKARLALLTNSEVGNQPDICLKTE